MRKPGGVLAANGLLAHVGAVDAAQRLQHFHFGVTDAVRRQIRRRRHGNHAQNLQQVVLDHVAHLTCLVKVTPATFNPHLFRHGDFHVVDSAVVPVIYKQGVSKTQRQQVQHRLFTEIMVDTVDLALFKELAYLVVDFTRGCQGRTQRLLHHDARRFGVQFGFAQALADGAEGAWRHGEIVNGDTVFLIQHRAQASERADVIHVKVAEIETTAQGIPQTFINFFLHESFERLADDFGISVLVPVGAPNTQDTRIRMNLARFLQLIQGRQQFSACKIAFRAENDQVTCLGCLRYRHVILLSWITWYFCQVSL